MKISIRSSVFAAAFLFLVPAAASAQGSEREAVDQAMRTMMRAFEAGDANVAFEVLRKDGVVLGYSASKASVVTQTAEEWARGFPGRPADDEARRKRSYEILDVSESGAVVLLSTRTRSSSPWWRRRTGPGRESPSIQRSALPAASGRRAICRGSAVHCRRSAPPSP